MTLLDPRVLVGGQFSIRRFFEAHAYSGTAFDMDEREVNQYRAGCECGGEFGPIIGDEDDAHAELLELWSAHTIQALVGQLLVSLAGSLAETEKRPG